MLIVQPMARIGIINMFVANFTTDQRARSKNLSIKVSLLDFLIYRISPEKFMKRFNKQFTNDFSNYNFKGVNYYGKK